MSTVSNSPPIKSVEQPGGSGFVGNNPALTADPVPLLRNGDHLTGVEFDRRYAAMPHLKKAELIEGRVYIAEADFRRPGSVESTMASPVTFRGHASPHYQSNGWLFLYSSSTPGVS